MFGNIGTTYHLWRHENFDEAQALRTMWISNQASNFIDFSKYYTGDHEFQAQFLPFLRKIQGQLSPSAHRTPNFTNPEFQFPQFKVLQSVFFFLIERVILAFSGVF